jgi:ABC-type polysaccharide/polyol phosphate transport system ATPase subunit
MVTHDIKAAEQFTNRMLILEKGVLQYFGETAAYLGMEENHPLNKGIKA